MQMPSNQQVIMRCPACRTLIVLSVREKSNENGDRKDLQQMFSQKKEKRKKGKIKTKLEHSDLSYPIL